MTMQLGNDVLSKIMSGHFSAMPSDKELAGDLNRTVPESLRKALDEAKAALATLQSERASLPGDLDAANRRADYDEIKRLREREKTIKEDLRNANLAVLDASMVITDEELAPLFAAQAENAKAITDMQSLLLQLRIVERRQQLINQLITNVRSVAQDIKNQRGKL